jgi:hypothetical protein
LSSSSGIYICDLSWFFLTVWSFGFTPLDISLPSKIWTHSIPIYHFIIELSFTMHFKCLSLAALVSSVSAQQSLNATLAANNQTSQLAALLGTLPNVMQMLGGASNITVLAPSNAALTALLNTTAGKAFASNPDAVTAL